MSIALAGACAVPKSGNDRADAPTVEDSGFNGDAGGNEADARSP